MSYRPKDAYSTLISGLGFVTTSDLNWSSLPGKPTFHVVATSGSYSDLTNKPALFSGSYTDLANKPSLFDGTWASLSGKPTTFTPATHSHVIADVTGLQTALDGKQPSGSYLTAVPTHSLDLTTDSATRLAMTAAERTKLSGVSTGATANATDAQLRDRSTHTGTQAASTVTGLATVATTGSYNDLLNKPAGGTGSDPWTVVKLVADYTNATITFANVTDGTTVLTFTPPANTDWELEGRILIETTTIANLPRIGVAIGAGAARGYGRSTCGRQARPLPHRFMRTADGAMQTA